MIKVLVLFLIITLLSEFLKQKNNRVRRNEIPGILAVSLHFLINFLKLHVTIM